MKALTAIKIIILVSLVVVGLTICFPPWATVLSGNSYPCVAFSWIGSPPRPFHNPGDAPEGLAYRLDEQRLMQRIAVVLTTMVILSLGIAFIPSPRARKVALIATVGLLAVFVVGVPLHQLYERHVGELKANHVSGSENQAGKK